MRIKWMKIEIFMKLQEIKNMYKLKKWKLNFKKWLNKKKWIEFILEDDQEELRVPCRWRRILWVIENACASELEEIHELVLEYPRPPLLPVRGNEIHALRMKRRVSYAKLRTVL